jgi:hypothetical protein
MHPVQAESKLSTNGGMGGGLYAVMWTSRVFLTRTQFTNNTATASGAGAHMFGVNSTLTVVNTTLTGNVAGLPGDATTGAAMVAAAMMVPTRGGGIHVTGASVKGLVVNSTFVQNGASLGAGLSFAPDEGSLVVSNSTRFRLNEAASQGGGLLVGQGVGLLVTNTSFSNNTARAAQGAGGGLCCMRCRNPVLQGCRFRGNAAAFGGGAALLQPTGTSQVVNCRFSANSALVAAPSTTAAGMPSSDESSMGGLRSLDAQYWPMSWRRVGSRAPAKLPLATNATFDSGAYSGGGGLYVSPQAAFNLSGSTFVNNSGLNGGELGYSSFSSRCPPLLSHLHGCCAAVCCVYAAHMHVFCVQTYTCIAPQSTCIHCSQGLHTLSGLHTLVVTLSALLLLQVGCWAGRTSAPRPTVACACPLTTTLLATPQ